MVKGKRLTSEVKLALLQPILEKKDILFGQFSSTLEHPQKKAAWGEILSKAKSLGVCEETRDWKFVRDKLFGQWKMNTLAKRDNSRKTGTGGGKNAVVTDVDLKIMEIIGKDSPIIDGLNIGESSVQMSQPGPSGNQNPELSDNDNEDELPQTVTQNPSTSQHPHNTTVQAGKKPPKRKLRFIHSEILDNKRLKQTELLDVAIYNEKLNAYEKEQRLGLPPSKFTIELYKRIDVLAIEEVQD